jgi:hypothetical protein
MMKEIAKVIFLWTLLCAGAMSSSSSSPKVDIMVRRLHWVRCGTAPGLKISLQVRIHNTSTEALVVGRTQIAQERLWRDTDKGKLELIRTSDTPDEFVHSSHPDAFGEIQEQHLPIHGTKTISMSHHVYLSPKDVQHVGGSRKVIVSFHVTNVRRDGSVSDYWSEPVSIVLPEGCSLE